MAKVKPLVEEKPRRRTCLCKAASPYDCMSLRYTTSIDFAKCLNGCSCDCHQQKDGAEIADETWQRMRESV